MLYLGSICITGNHTHADLNRAIAHPIHEPFWWCQTHKSNYGAGLIATRVVSIEQQNRPIKAFPLFRTQSSMTQKPKQVLNTAHAKGVDARSVVVRRLHASSKSWGDELVQRKQRFVVGVNSGIKMISPRFHDSRPRTREKFVGERQCRCSQIHATRSRIDSSSHGEG